MNSVQINRMIWEAKMRLNLKIDGNAERCKALIECRHFGRRIKSVIEKRQPMINIKPKRSMQDLKMQSDIYFGVRIEVDDNRELLDYISALRIPADVNRINPFAWH